MVVLFLLELFSYMLIMKLLLHIPITASRPKLLISALLTIIWAIYSYYTEPVIPNTFIIFSIILLLFYKEWYIKFCAVTVFTLLLNIISSIIFYVYCILTNNLTDHNTHDNILSFLSLVGICIAVILLSRKIPTKNIPYRTISRKGYYLITITAFVDFILSSISSMLFYYNLHKAGRYLVIFAIFIIIIISAVVLVMYFRLQYYHMILQQQNDTNKKLLALEEEHYRKMQEKNLDLRAFRHDYNNHIVALREYIDHDNLKEARNYLNDFMKVQALTHYYFTNNPVGDAIINYFYENRPVNTSFKVNGKFPRDIFLSGSELCTILSNLLKNADEAVRQLPESNQKKIYLFLHGNDEEIAIHIENTSNPYQDTEMQQLSTQKPDILNHGIGLKNVRNVIDRYRGTLILNYDNGFFTALASLYHVEK